MRYKAWLTKNNVENNLQKDTTREARRGTGSEPVSLPEPVSLLHAPRFWAERPGLYPLRLKGYLFS